MPINGQLEITPEQAAEGMDQVGLLDRVVVDSQSWQVLDAVIAVPWNSFEIDK